VFDPWGQAYGSVLKEARSLTHWHDRVKALAEAAQEIGRMNELGIRNSEAILAVLDGAELDSGTVSELGFAYGLGKRCYGLRNDFRNVGDLEGLPFNLQVLYFIESSGGRLFRSIREMEI
jgi:hypothetical protein